MKLLVIALMITSAAFAGPKTLQKTLPVDKDVVAANKEVAKAKPAPTAKAQEVLKDKEDCDDKAKKEVKIEPEAITLGGNTGCSLDEM